MQRFPTSGQRDLASSDLSSGERKLLELMSQLDFGRIERVAIRNGQPVLEQAISVRDVKLDAPANPPERPSGDFSLKQPVVALFGALRGIRSGVIRKLEVRHGLPTHLQIEELAEGLRAEPRGPAPNQHATGAPRC